MALVRGYRTGKRSVGIKIMATGTFPSLDILFFFFYVNEFYSLIY